MTVFSACPLPPISQFTRFFMAQNGLNDSMFTKWIFESAMLFQSTDMWWGNRGKRYRPHEGVDFCMFADGRNQMVRLDGKSRIPAMYDGVVLVVVKDFLGKSIIVEHAFRTDRQERFCTVTSHVRPCPNIVPGRKIREGDVLATVEDAFPSKRNISPHLHISLGWIPRSIANERLVWPEIGSPEVMTLLDPLDFIVSG